MIAAMNQDSPILVGGVPLATMVQAAIRTAREAAAAAIAPLPEISAASVPAAPAELVVLACTLHGFTLAELTVEADRIAAEAAAHRDHVACYAFGATYGDREMKESWRAGDPDPCLLRLHAQASTRADQAAATADFLRALVGREAAVELALTGGAGV